MLIEGLCQKKGENKESSLGIEVFKDNFFLDILVLSRQGQCVSQ